MAPDMSVLTVSGESIQLSSLWAERPLLLAFTRHFGCTQCKEMLDELVRGRERIEKAGLGIAVITVILLASSQLEEKISQNSRGIDLVVGAKGSPLQLILCNIFHIDFPTGNINLAEAERIAKRNPDRGGDGLSRH